MAPPVPPSGVWAPAITFYSPTSDTLDLTSQSTYYTYLSRSGLTGLVILGTNAETMLLTRSERLQLLQTARSAVGPSYPIMAGVGAHSTAQCLEFIADAVSASADYILVLPPAYFGKQSTPAVIERFYDSIAQASPLPIVLYNFPGVCNGVDLDSEFIARLARKHANIVGVKLTCASVGKITRLSAALAPDRFAVFGGQSDFLIGGLASGSAGCIAAFANVFPKTISRVYALWKEGKVEEALSLHKKAALAESPCKAGIASTKYAASVNSARRAGIEGAVRGLRPREPYEEVGEETKKKIEEVMKEVSEIEDTL